MKLKHPDDLQSGFWLKLIAILAAVGIVVVLVFGGIQNVMQQFSDLQSELDSTSDALDEKSRQLEQASSSLDETSTALSNAESAFSAKSDELDVARAELADTEAELESARSQLSELTLERDEALAGLQQTENTLEEAVSQVDQLHAELEEQNSQIDGLESELVAARQSLAATADELDAAQSKIDTLRGAQATLTADLAEAQSREYSARSALRRAKAQLDSVSAELAAAEIYTAHYRLESDTYILTLSYASCIVEEYVSLAQFYFGEEREFAAEQIERFERYLSELEPVGSYNPVSPYCDGAREFYSGELDHEAVEESATEELATETDMSAAKAKVTLGNLMRETAVDDESVNESGSLVRQWQALLPSIHQRIVQLLGEELAAKSVELRDGVLFVLIDAQ